jgi:hypothetical protein
MPVNRPRLVVSLCLLLGALPSVGAAEYAAHIDGSVPPAVVPQSAAASAAASNAARLAALDPLLTPIDKLVEPEWNGHPLEVFVNTGKDFGAIAGTSLPVPYAESPAMLQEFGCTHALVKQFDRTQRQVRLIIYTFYSPDGAYAAYSCLRRGASTVVVRGGASSEDDDSISFWKGARFVVISTRSDDDEVSKELVSKLADQVQQAISADSAKPSLLYRLPSLYRVRGSEKLFMGQLAARRFGNVPHLSELELERSSGAAFAEYQTPPPGPDRMRALIVDYGNLALARNVYTNYSEAMSEGRKTQLVDADALLTRLSSGYLLCALRGPKVIILSGARHKDAATFMARQLAY